MNSFVMAKYQGGRGTGREIAKGVEVPWPLDLARKWSPDKKPRTRICQELEENKWRRGGGTRGMDVPTMSEPPGADRDLVASRKRQRGGQTSEDVSTWRGA